MKVLALKMADTMCGRRRKVGGFQVTFTVAWRPLMNMLENTLENLRKIVQITLNDMHA